MPIRIASAGTERLRTGGDPSRRTHRASLVGGTKPFESMVKRVQSGELARPSGRPISLRLPRDLRAAKADRIVPRPPQPMKQQAPRGMQGKVLKVGGGLRGGADIGREALPTVAAASDASLMSAGAQVAAAAGSSLLFQGLCLEALDIDPSQACFFPILALTLSLGASFTALADFEFKRFCRMQEAERRPLRVVITGGTKGVGKALARAFLQRGDSVVISSRCPRNVSNARMDLARQSGATLREIKGIACDVSRADEVDRLAREARRQLGGVDVWVNNAGYSGSFKFFADSDVSDLRAIVETNLLGALHGTRAALSLFEEQEGGGHVFNMDGAGCDGSATPQYAAYGATKAAIAQMNESIHRELEQQRRTSPSSRKTREEEAAHATPWSILVRHATNAWAGEGKEGKEGKEGGLQGGRVGVHTLSPGMVLTDLLLDGSTRENRLKFNILCEHPETVAEDLVPRIRRAAAAGKSGTRIRYLTAPRALGYVLRWPLRAGRFFDKQGQPKYLDESERVNTFAIGMAHWHAEVRRMLARYEKRRELKGRLVLAFCTMYVLISASASGAITTPF